MQTEEEKEKCKNAVINFREKAKELTERGTFLEKKIDDTVEKLKQKLEALILAESDTSLTRVIRNSGITLESKLDWNVVLTDTFYEVNQKYYGEKLSELHTTFLAAEHSFGNYNLLP